VRVKALVAQLQAELIFTLGTKTAVTLMAGADPFVMGLFAGMNFWMGFNHCGFSTVGWASSMPCCAIEEKRLTWSCQPANV